jgi:cytochrome c5
MNRWKAAGVIAAITLVGCLALRAQQSSSGAKEAGAKGSTQQTHSIQLPDKAGEILPGPHVDIYSKDCLLCHSARYVSMQPGFSKEVWQSEVKKMVNAYGASIPESDQALIVEYLVAVRGPQPADSTAKSPK